MRFLSLFSGIEAASVAWLPLGWCCVGFSEIEPFPCAVLAHHYPEVPNLGDVTKISEEMIKNLGHIDIIIFGSPCQNLSAAGTREGLHGSESRLFFEAIRIIRYARKSCGLRFALFENVPGAFSCNEGKDFAKVVEHLSGCRDITVPIHGWGSEGAALGDDALCEWCVLDSQWRGLAQQRKRVFALADFGDWQGRKPILLERKSVSGHPPTRRKSGQDTPKDIAGCLRSGGSGGVPSSRGENLVSVYLGNEEGGAKEIPFLTVQGLVAGSSNQAPLIGEPIPIDLRNATRSPEKCDQGVGIGNQGDPAYTLSKDFAHGVACFDARGNGNGDISCTLTGDYANRVTDYTPLVTQQHGYGLDIARPICCHEAKSGCPAQDNFIVEQKTFNVTFCDANGRRQDRPNGGLYVNETDTTGTLTEAGNNTLITYACDYANITSQACRSQPKEDCAPTLSTDNRMAIIQNQPVAIDFRAIEQKKGDIVGTLQSKSTGGYSLNYIKGVMQNMCVRRITPKEACRLQGFPDDYLDIIFRGKPASDTPKYKALGNSMATNVIKYIGEQIDKITKEQELNQRGNESTTPH